jgi:hypothetical protein
MHIIRCVRRTSLGIDILGLRMSGMRASDLIFPRLLGKLQTTTLRTLSDRFSLKLIRQ